MKKPKAFTKKIISYHEMVNYIQTKYKCDLDDYAAHKNGVKDTLHFNVDHQEKWELDHYPKLAEFRKNPVKNYGMNKEGMDFYETPEGMRWFDEIRNAYQNASDGKCKELPFWCFWHFMIDIFDISNGSTRQINWVELIELCDEDWQKEICRIFAKEFGEEMEVDFSW